MGVGEMRGTPFRVVVTGLAMVCAGLSTGIASADHCGEDKDSAHDPFGSCEVSGGSVVCGSEGAVSQEVPGGRLTIGEQGVQYCVDQELADGTPRGRVTVYNADGHTGVAVDGTDANDPGPLAPGITFEAFTRVDYDGSQVCVTSGGRGTTYWPEGGPKNGLICLS